MEKDVLQLKITLKDSTPPIWRRVLVRKETNFMQLHEIIQIVMGWTDSHLHAFHLDDYDIGEPDEDFPMEDDETIKSNTVKLSDVISEKGDTIEYEYDFGDGWEHDVLIEKVLKKESNMHYPVCTKGEMACPPEDCGGIFGFYELLSTIENTEHPEHEEMKEWLGVAFNPDSFDIDTVNERLKELDCFA